MCLSERFIWAGILFLFVTPGQVLARTSITELEQRVDSVETSVDAQAATVSELAEATTGQSLSNVTIKQVTVNTTRTLAFIEGVNFDNGDFPIVMLGGDSLNTTSISPNQITVELPVNLDGGSYRIGIRTGNAIGKFDEFEFSVKDAPDALPPGLVSAFYSSTCPSGWIEANGQNSTPDLRGVFIRGMNGGDSGLDPDGNRTLGNYQTDSFKSHTHQIRAPGGSNNNAFESPNVDWGTLSQPQHYNTEASGASETRPKNIALLYCIKN